MNANSDLPAKPRIIALVPMKHHSERVPRKNFRLFQTKPLFHWIVEALLGCEKISEVVVDTDSLTISDGLKKHFPAVKVINRPESLCGDFVPMNEILLHDIKTVPGDIYLQTHSTNPLLRSETISAAIDAFLDRYPEHDSLFAVKKWQTRFYDQLGNAVNHNPAVLLRTQDLPPVYEENSCIYIFRPEVLRARRNRVGYRPQLFVMSDVESTDIDTEIEYTIAEVLARNQAASGKVRNKMAAKLEIAKGITRVRPVKKAKKAKRDLTVLISAPHIMPHFEGRFRELLESFGLNIVVAPVTERLEAEDLMKYAGTYDGTICGDDYYTPEVFEANAGRLKVVSKWGTGIDSIDQECAKKHGVMIGNTPNAFSRPVADSVLAFILHFSRKQSWMDKHMKSGLWEKIAGCALNERTIGILGCGDVGKAVARRVFGFEARILCTDIVDVDPAFLKQYNVKQVPLETLLKESDFLSVNCFLSPSTHHIINAKTLGQMKPTAILINTARGPCVKEADLVEALQAGTIAGAGLDVFEFEPLPGGSPLRSMDNVLMSPHNTNSSPLAHENVHWNTIRNLLKGMGVEYEDFVYN